MDITSGILTPCAPGFLIYFSAIFCTLCPWVSSVYARLPLSHRPLHNKDVEMAFRRFTFSYILIYLACILCGSYGIYTLSTTATKHPTVTIFDDSAIIPSSFSLQATCCLWVIVAVFSGTRTLWLSRMPFLRFVLHIALFLLPLALGTTLFLGDSHGT